MKNLDSRLPDLMSTPGLLYRENELEMLFATLAETMIQSPNRAGSHFYRFHKSGCFSNDISVYHAPPFQKISLQASKQRSKKYNSGWCNGTSPLSAVSPSNRFNSCFNLFLYFLCACLLLLCKCHRLCHFPVLLWSHSENEEKHLPEGEKQA